MSKTVLVLFIFISGLIFEGLTAVNNTIFSSELLQKALSSELQSGVNLSDITAGDIIKARKCFLQLQQIVNELPNQKTSRFLDSWGKFPSGILFGHLTEIGNYDECVRTSVNFNGSTEVTHGKYCLAAIPLSSTSGKLISENDLSFIRQTPMDVRAISNSIKIKLGVCFPDTCDEKLITNILQKGLSNVFNSTFNGTRVSKCSVSQKPPYEPADIFAIVLFSLFGVLMLLSTLYDWFTVYFERKRIQLLLSFSVISNGKKIFSIKTGSSANTIECLTGIRVLSMAWILHCHNYMLFVNLNIINIIDAMSWFKQPWSLTVLMATVSVDSFFLISGLLVAWLVLRELDRGKGKLNVIMMWIHRYIRLTPPLAAGILFLVTLNKFIGSGPFREDFVAMHGTCKENWWATLLYVQNYVTPNKICFMQSWYLAVDTQLYLLSPIVLIPLWKWGRKFSPVLILLSLFSVSCIIATSIVEGYTSLIGFDERTRMEKLYYPTHTRYSVWLVGLGLGYFMHVNRQKTLRPAKILQLIGWIVCFVTIISILFGPYFTINSLSNATVAEAAMYESFKRIAWGVALAWIVFACHFGFGGIVNSFLSHPFWQPLSRLTYCLYLVHIAVASINFGMIRVDVYFSDYTLALNFWSNFGISLLVAIVFSLAFEAPILGIEKVIFGGGKSKTQLNTVPLSSAPNPAFLKV